MRREIFLHGMPPAGRLVFGAPSRIDPRNLALHFDAQVLVTKYDSRATLFVTKAAAIFLMDGAAMSEREIEIKLLLRQKDVARLRGHPALWAGFERAGEAGRQASVYFDDRKRTLRRQGVSLRVRRVGEQRIQTIKALNGRAGPIERGEWQTLISDTRPDLAAAAGTALQPLLPKLRSALEPLFETRVDRTEFSMQFGDSEIAVALDQGEIDTGKIRSPICEVELELKQGKRGDLFRLAEQLQETVPLELSYLTKSARGYALLGAPDATFGKAGDVHLRPGMSIADAFRALAHDCLRHVAENRAGVARREAEALHQMRIAIRRLRTTLSLFRSVVAGPGAKFVKSELRWLREHTGPARDLDVFTEEVAIPLREQYPRDKAVMSMHRHVRQRRQQAYKAVREAVLSARFREFTLRAAAWLEDGDWRSGADALAQARQDAPIEVFAADRLSALLRKVRKEGKRLRDCGHEGRHSLRVRVKRLRYSVEFMASLASDKRSRKRAQAMIDALKRLQDKLGGLNDISVRPSLTAEFAGKVKLGGNRRQSRREQIFLAGLIAARQHAEFTTLIEEAEEAFAAFRKAKPFWSGLAEFPVLRLPARNDPRPPVQPRAEGRTDLPEAKAA